MSWQPRCGRPIEILLVEDNPAEVRLTQEVLHESKGASRIRVTGNGREALAYLRRQGEYANARRPSLILLDLNLPLKDGREVLQEIKQDPELRRIPVVVLTSSHAEEDILQAYELHANCYMCKPVDLDEFTQTLRSIQEYWFTMVKLPPW